MPSDPDLTISKAEDWRQFRERGLESILDPMVFRAGDVFLRGQQVASQTLSSRDAEQVWSVLSGDVSSLFLFFDQLVFSERLPLIDYGTTYDSQLGYDTPWIGRLINERMDAKVVETVHVMGDMAQTARSAAIASLPERPLQDPHIEAEIYRHLNVFDYQWRPYFLALEGVQEPQATVLRFLYGGLMFSAFCQMSGSAHVLQSKRWRLSTAMAVGVTAIAQEQERELIDEVNRRIAQNPQLAPIPFDTLPSVLPHLLRRTPEAKSSAELLAAVKALRTDGEIGDYREWRRELIQDWRAKGFVSETNEKRLKQAAGRIARRLDPDSTVEVDFVKAEAGLTGVGVDPGVRCEIPTSRIWGWVLDQIPGHRYVKVLTRLALDQRQYPKIERHLRTLWNGASA
jgi:hypothetical protein